MTISSTTACIALLLATLVAVRATGLSFGPPDRIFTIESSERDAEHLYKLVDELLSAHGFKTKHKALPLEANGYLVPPSMVGDVITRFENKSGATIFFFASACRVRLEIYGREREIFGIGKMLLDGLPGRISGWFEFIDGRSTRDNPCVRE